MPSTLSFLDLPIEARLKVYSYAGLIRHCPIDLAAPRRSTLLLDNSMTGPYGNFIPHNCWLFDEGHDRFEGGNSHRHPLNCFCPDLPTALLLVSEEAISILVGRNKFILRAHTGPDLTLLQTMNLRALAAMTSLLVRLNCWPCPRGHNDGDPPERSTRCRTCDTPKALSDPVLNEASHEGQDLIQRWRIICKRLSSVIAPGQLRFTFICDVISLKTAEQVVEPLLTLPRLQQCTIRLGRERNNEIRALAERVSFQATGTFVPRSGFPFERLPRELRWRILSFTHLTAPGTYHSDWDIFRIKGGKFSGRGFYSNPTTCCWKCTDTFADCCCPKSYASYSASCVCRMLPFALFSVSKQMYEDAFQVFYLNVFFEFHSDPEDTLFFLKGLPTHALRLLRRLRFLFGETDLSEWNRRNYTQKWQNLVFFIKENLDVPNLSIEIDTNIGASELCLFIDDFEETRFLYDIYCEIGRALRILPNLNDLWFNNGWFVNLGPLLAREVIGERYKEREDLAQQPGQRRLKGQWEVPIWWYKRDVESNL